MKENRRRHVRGGFTMVELMAVLIILGLLAGVVVRSFVGQTEKAKVTTTKASLKSLANAVNEFYMDANRWPEQDEGLSVLVQQPSDVVNYPMGGYLETTEVTKDGWGRDFIYELYPAEVDKPFLIKSYGRDGQEGGEDYDADLRHTDP